jgi:hypothetical protein
METEEFAVSTFSIGSETDAAQTTAGDGSSRIVDLRERRDVTVLPCDDLRQLTVVVWARTKLLERLLAAQGAGDPRLLAGLAEIDEAVAALGARIDALEDGMSRRAA